MLKVKALGERSDATKRHTENTAKGEQKQKQTQKQKQQRRVKSQVHTVRGAVLKEYAPVVEPTEEEEEEEE